MCVLCHSCPDQRMAGALGMKEEERKEEGGWREPNEEQTQKKHKAIVALRTRADHMAEKIRTLS